jgi:hypothetical protein
VRLTKKDGAIVGFVARVQWDQGGMQ